LLITDDNIEFKNTNFELLMTEAVDVDSNFLDSKFLSLHEDENSELVSIRSLLGSTNLKDDIFKVKLE